MPGGRPTEYNEKILERAREYLTSLPEDEFVHSIEGLALYLDITRPTIYDWKSQEDKKEFSYIVDKILANQGKTLINNGITKKFDSSITKLMLTKHGYRDSIETDITSKGEKITGDITRANEIAKKYEEELKGSL